MATNCRAKNPNSCRFHGATDAIATLQKEVDNAAYFENAALYMSKRAELDVIKENAQAHVPEVEMDHIPNNIDWKNMSSEEATEIALQVAETVSDPNKTWRNLDFYNKMLVSERRREAFAVMEQEDVTQRIWITWRRHHNAVGDYTPVEVKGAEGWAVFEPAYRKMDSAHYAVKKEIAAESGSFHQALPYGDDSAEPWEDFLHRRHTENRTKPKEPAKVEKALAKLKSMAWPPAWMD